MKDIKKKLNDRQGASILIALLFMLVCIMAGASVLFASASNAGKARSNKEEQQKYLSVSSALKLICDELTYHDEATGEDVYYIGHYYYQDTDTSDPSHLVYTYQQGKGELVKSTAAGPPADIELNKVLPVYDLLDKVLSEKYVAASDVTKSNGDPSDPESKTFKYAARSDAGDLADKCRVTLNFNGGDYGNIMHNVVITAELVDDYSYSLKLTAELEGDNADAYRMEASLIPRFISGKPHPQIPVPDPYANPLEHHEADSGDGSETGAVGWELKNITRK